VKPRTIVLTVKGELAAQLADRYDTGLPPRSDAERATFSSWYARDCDDMAALARAEQRQVLRYDPAAGYSMPGA
jgi:hypothetical protein